jgi:hypothetical protein
MCVPVPAQQDETAQQDSQTQTITSAARERSIIVTDAASLRRASSQSASPPNRSEADANLETVMSKEPNPKNLTPGSIRPPHLSAELSMRIEAIRAALAEVCPISAEEWLNGFQRDHHPEREIVWWERLARCYSDFTAEKTLSLEQRQAAFKVIFGLFGGLEAKGVVADAAALSDSLIDELLAICEQNG